MPITIFQALTLLAQKYRHSTTLFSMISSLYLSGVKSEKDRSILAYLLKDNLLEDYEINLSKKNINDDPVRRYFESHLSHNTLAVSLDELDLDLLSYYYDEVSNEIKTYELWESYQVLLHPPADGERFFNIRMENTEGLRILKKSSSYQGLSPTQIEDEEESITILKQRKNKMLRLANISYASWFFAYKMGRYLPLDIYRAGIGHYNARDRGRKYKEQQTVQSQTLGIMRSYMPLSRDDVLLSNEPARYVRPADQSTYIPGAKQAELSFQTLVTPFCNSISGTLLCQLQVMAEIVQKEAFVFSQNESQLKLYFKSYIAYMLLHSGGHSLDEYVRVLRLPEVQETFASEPGFAELTLDCLFRVENASAFEKAMDETIVYNQYILNNKRISNTLKQLSSRRTSSERTRAEHPERLSGKENDSTNASELTLTNKTGPLFPMSGQFFRSLELTPSVSYGSSVLERPVPRSVLPTSPTVTSS